MLGAVTAGAAGAVALTLVHEGVRRVADDAPRMDVLGERALAAGLRAAGAEPPPEPQLHRLALAGDLASNTAYYSLVGLSGGPEGAVARGLLLGVVAGVGAVYLPGPLGLGEAPSRRTPQTAAMTVAWYTLGGLVAGLAYSALACDPERAE